MSKSPKQVGVMTKNALGRLRPTQTVKNAVVAEAKRLRPGTHISHAHIDRIKGPAKIRDEQ